METYPLFPGQPPASRWTIGVFVTLSRCQRADPRAGFHPADPQSLCGEQTLCTEPASHTDLHRMDLMDRRQPQHQCSTDRLTLLCSRWIMDLQRPGLRFQSGFNALNGSEINPGCWESVFLCFACTAANVKGASGGSAGPEVGHLFLFSQTKTVAVVQTLGARLSEATF